MNGKIVLSGLAGSGKSTVGKLLARQVGWKFISMGEFSRDFAKREFGMDINTFQDHCKQNPELDGMLDKQFVEFCNSGNNLIIDYRLGFHFIPDAISIFLEVSGMEAAKRISLSGRLDETPETIVSRNKKMVDRLRNKYGVDFSSPKNYTCIINTDGKSPAEICELIKQIYF